MGDVPYDTVTTTAQRRRRRLSDKILIAFHQACDQADLEVAERLLSILEAMTTPQRRARAPRGSERRRRRETLVAAHERLWQLRHPDVESGAEVRAWLERAKWGHGPARNDPSQIPKAGQR
jgi:hypothetical protein